MTKRVLTIFLGAFPWFQLLAQENSGAFAKVSIENNDDFSGYELLQPNGQQLFILAENWHNIRLVPQATLKLLKYLHREGNVRILAIEQGASSAHMINSYLQSGDTTKLQQITRNTLFWGIENRSFFYELRKFNLSLPLQERVFMHSIDIEYKMASAIFVINELIGEREVPESLKSTVGIYKHLFTSTKEHREQYDGLAVMYYYERDLVEQLVLHTLEELKNRETEFKAFFQEDFDQFKQTIVEMDQGIVFDYTNPNTNYKYRDRLIENKMIDLVERFPYKGILCPIGMRHATKGSSLNNLASDASSPLFGKMMNIRVSALYNRTINARDLKKFNFNYPQVLRVNQATLIKHNPDDAALKSSKGFDFTLFLNDSGSLTPFDNIYEESY